MPFSSGLATSLLSTTRTPIGNGPKGLPPSGQPSSFWSASGCSFTCCAMLLCIALFARNLAAARRKSEAEQPCGGVVRPCRIEPSTPSRTSSICEPNGVIWSESSTAPRMGTSTRSALLTAGRLSSMSTTSTLPSAMIMLGSEVGRKLLKPMLLKPMLLMQIVSACAHEVATLT